MARSQKQLEALARGRELGLAKMRSMTEEEKRKARLAKSICEAAGQVLAQETETCAGTKILGDLTQREILDAAKKIVLESQESVKIDKLLASILSTGGHWGFRDGHHPIAALLNMVWPMVKSQIHVPMFSAAAVRSLAKNTGLRPGLIITKKMEELTGAVIVQPWNDLA